MRMLDSVLLHECCKKCKLFSIFFHNGEYKLRYPHSTLIFKTEALRLVSNVQLVKRLLPCNEQQIQR